MVFLLSFSLSWWLTGIIPPAFSLAISGRCRITEKGTIPELVNGDTKVLKSSHFVEEASVPMDSWFTYGSKKNLCFEVCL